MAPVYHPNKFSVIPIDAYAVKNRIPENSILHLRPKMTVENLSSLDFEIHHPSQRDDKANLRDNLPLSSLSSLTRDMPA